MAAGISFKRNSRSACSMEEHERLAAIVMTLHPRAAGNSRQRTSSGRRSAKASRRKRVLSPIYWEGVLISWAIPAANWPMDSSFWACANWASSSLRSVISENVTTAPSDFPLASESGVQVYSTGKLAPPFPEQVRFVVANHSVFNGFPDRTVLRGEGRSVPLRVVESGVVRLPDQFFRPPTQQFACRGGLAKLTSPACRRRKCLRLRNSGSCGSADGVAAVLLRPARSVMSRTITVKSCRFSTQAVLIASSRGQVVPSLRRPSTSRRISGAVLLRCGHPGAVRPATASLSSMGKSVASRFPTTSTAW